MALLVDSLGNEHMINGSVRRIEKIRFENEWRKEIDKLRHQNEHYGKLIKVMGEKIGILRKESKKEDELIALLKTDIKTHEKANLLLENNIKILRLSMNL